MISFFCAAQNEEESSAAVVDSATSHYQNMIPTDSILKKPYATDNIIYEKQFKPDFRKKYQTEEFNYTTIKPQESLWEKIKRKISKIFQSIFGELDQNKANSYTEMVLRFLAIVVIGLVLYFLISYLISKDGNFLFSKKNKKIQILSEDLHENIHEINFPETISRFEREKNYRAAVRYQFLFVLKKLSDKKIINWNPEKTNSDYIVEIQNSQTRDQFKELVRIFDYVWYGEFEINEQNYVHYKAQFAQM